MDKNSWDDARYAREKRQFVDVRLRHRSISAHLWSIFAATWAAGWGVSALLLQCGIKDMPLRYGLALAASYPVFFLCVKIWAGALREPPTATSASNSDLGEYLNLPVDGEGCLVALAALALGGLLAAVFALLGGSELLLEAAFEVVFAGTMVRRLRRLEVIGNWKARLLRNTAPFAVGVMVCLVSIAAGLQHAAPQATSFAQACRVIYLQTAGAKQPR